jgi:P27 family predicted phage terminase small subunit
VSKFRGGDIRMSAGRPGKTKELKALQGTDRKDREKDNIQFTLITICPKAESWLDTKGKKNFKNFCELLIEKRLLTNTNIGHVAIMAQELSIYEDACRKIKKDGMTQIMETKNGSTYEQVTPWVAIRNTAQKNYRDYASLFGLDPASSQKIGGAKKNEEDPFDQMQNKYNQ